MFFFKDFECQLVKFSAKLNKDISEVVLDNAQGNAKYISPAIQKEILNIFAVKVREKIRKDIENAKFFILVDESKDNSGTEQMAIVVRYVDKEGNVKERFFDVQRVDNVCSLTLKNGSMNVLTRFDLQVQNLRGQGYDGANNMWGAMNGLQALFLKDCPYAYYVHCFAHRLQLALEKAAKNNGNVWSFYSMLNSIITLVTASSRRTSDFQSAQEEDTEIKIQNGDVETGKGDNQLGTCESSDDYSVGEAQDTDENIKSFKFIFVLLLMHKIMGIIDTLCQGLQLKSQDIVNAMNLVSPTKTLLQRLRDDGWKKLLESVELFCEKHDTHMPDMKARHLIGTGRSCQI
ncbi:zinc finger MYM-type protein 1-like [Papaver somniferum]|uniref:zinc finger MYM-type protein 1-like n=1 Tax=Papaver somniferum TaxID=3469 RepID=UPI000E7041FA|nr:zinc finger MYM-type protein 1-like [Papaver somniferum]